MSNIELADFTAPPGKQVTKRRQVRDPLARRHRSRQRGLVVLSISLTAASAIALLLLSAGQGFPAVKDLPVVGGKPVLALVNGEPVTLEQFDRAFAESHAGMMDNAARPRQNPSQLLDRLINAKLILQEARNIGLDELPEVKSAEKTVGEDTLRRMLYSYHVRNIRKPDKKEVDKRYRDAVKEVKVASVLFDREEDGKRLEAEARAGGKFERCTTSRGGRSP